MYLSGSEGTGKKISTNREHFSFDFKESETENEKTLYRFYWTFDKQHGYMSITVRNSDNKLANSSLIGTDIDSPYKFGRPLGLYNDASLLTVFYAVLRSINVFPAGEYADW